MKTDCTKDAMDSTQAPITEKAREAAHDAVEKIAISSEEIEKKARQSSQMTEERMHAIANDTKEVGQIYLDKATQYVQENPLKALGIAVASGYIVAKLMRSKG